MTDDTTTYTIGPGVQQAMAAAGDEPRSDEQFIILLEGHQVSQTFGRDAVYYWLQEDNATKRLPFR
jgi:hypothetical protein